MVKKGVLAKVGAMVAILGLLILPLGSCQGQNFTGVDVFKTENIELSIQMFFSFSLIFAVVALFISGKVLCSLVGGGGIVSFFISYFIANQDGMINLEIGAYFAIVGFVLVILDGFLSEAKKQE